MTGIQITVREKPRNPTPRNPSGLDFDINIKYLFDGARTDKENELIRIIGEEMELYVQKCNNAISEMSGKIDYTVN